MNGGGRLSSVSSLSSRCLGRAQPCSWACLLGNEEGSPSLSAVMAYSLRASVSPLKCTGAQRSGLGMELSWETVFPASTKPWFNLQHNLNPAWWDIPVIPALGWGVEAEEDEKVKVSLGYKMCSKSIWAVRGPALGGKNNTEAFLDVLPH